MKAHIPVLLAAGSGLLAIAATSFSSNSAPKLPLSITHDAANRAVNLGFEANDIEKYYLIEGRPKLDKGDWSLSYGIKGDGHNQSHPMPTVANKFFYRLMRVPGDDPSLAIDYDGDKVVLLEELDRGLDGFETMPADTDGDKIPNDFEVIHGLDKTDASDAVGDADNDGISNVDEFRLGDDPNAEEADRSTVALYVESSGAIDVDEHLSKVRLLCSYRHESGQADTSGHIYLDYRYDGTKVDEDFDKEGWSRAVFSQSAHLLISSDGQPPYYFNKSSGHYRILACTGQPIAFLIEHIEYVNTSSNANIIKTGPTEETETRFELVQWDGKELTIDGDPVSLPTGNRGCRYTYGSVTLPYRISIKANQIANGPFGSSPKYNDSPQVGNADNLFSVWENEDFIVNVELGDLLESGSLPSDFLVWEAEGFSIPNNTSEWTFSWGQPGFYRITLRSNQMDFVHHIDVHVPDVGSIGQNAAALAAGPIAGPLIGVYGVEAA
ncbi:MAG: hypothetical protein ACPGGJ_00435, partial [Coraliomargarita sp.]